GVPAGRGGGGAAGNGQLHLGSSGSGCSRWHRRLSAGTRAAGGRRPADPVHDRADPCLSAARDWTTRVAPSSPPEPSYADTLSIPAAGTAPTTWRSSGSWKIPRRPASWLA